MWPRPIFLYGDQAVPEGRGQKCQSQPMKSISAKQPFLGKEVFFVEMKFSFFFCFLLFFSCSLCTGGGTISLPTWNHSLQAVLKPSFWIPLSAQLLPQKPPGHSKSIQGSEVPGNQIKFRSGSWNRIPVLCLIQDIELWGLYGWERD